MSLDRLSERVSAVDENGEPISLVVSEGEKGNSCRGRGRTLDIRRVIPLIPCHNHGHFTAADSVIVSTVLIVS